MLKTDTCDWDITIILVSQSEISRTETDEVRGTKYDNFKTVFK